MKRAPVDIQASRNALAGKRDSVDTFARYHDDPCGFARDVLGIHPWAKQTEFLNLVAQHDRVAVKSGNKVSKTASVTILALWFVSTRRDARVIFTNSSSRQVRAVNWRETRRFYRRAAARIGGIMHATPDLGIQFPDDREVLGFTTDSPDRWGGISGTALLFICDEASGIPEEVFEAIEGCAAGGGAKIVLTGNPLRIGGTFHRAFKGNDLWKCMTIRSDETPTGKDRIPGLADRAWLERQRENWGEDSIAWRTRVLGEFPDQGDNTVISIIDAERAMERHSEAMRTFETAGALELGVDVARFGSDETVIFVRRGLVVKEPTVLRGLDTVAVTAAVLKVARDERRLDERPKIKVDGIGVGAGVVDLLRTHDDIDVVDVNVGSSATDSTYMRLRDQVWFGVKDWLRAGGAIPRDEKLLGELTGCRYHFSPNGKTQVEPKDEQKKRLARSPDRADALALALYEGRISYGCSSDYDSPMSDAYQDGTGREYVQTNLVGFI